MAKNPMQRKAQNSFLLGMLITLLITGIIIAVLILQLTKLTKESKKSQANMKSVYVVSQDIASGESVTTDKMTLKPVDGTTIPENALTVMALEEKMNTYNEDGILVKKVDVVSKIDLKAGTVITTDMIAEAGELTKDVRRVEYNMILLPSQLVSGKYVDIRLRLPNGADYVVVSKKKIEIPNIDGIDSLTTISMNLSEAEILTLSGAIVEAYQIEGAKLYAIEYVEPGLQDEKVATYVPSVTVLSLLTNDKDKNINEAKEGLLDRLYNYEMDENGNKKYTSIKDEASSNRDKINSALNQNSEQGAENINTRVEEEVQAIQEERQKYLESLGGIY